MTLSSAEKHSDTCPWRFPVREDAISWAYTKPLSQCSIRNQRSSSRSDCTKSNTCELQHPQPEPVIFSLSREAEDIVDGESKEAPSMGNVTPSAKGHKPTGCNPLSSSSDSKHVQQQNDLNSKQQRFQTIPKYIESKNGNVQKNISCSDNTRDSNASKTEQESYSSSRPSSDRTTSPVPTIGLENIRLTADVNNSRPHSRSTTPVLTRKPAIRDSPMNPYTSPQPSSTAAVVDQNRSNSSSSLKDSQAKDIMISYSHLDKEIMLKLKDALEAHNISVWVDFVGLNAGVNFLNKIGQAIIDSKMFITLLTERTVASKFCQDELALAYISNKPIFPVSMKPQSEIFPDIPTGMKLQLARFEWTQIRKDHFDEDVGLLLNKLKACLDEIEGVKEEDQDEVPPLSPSSGDMPLQRKPVLRKRYTRTKIYHRPNRSLSRCNSIIEQTEDIDSQAEFWDRNFGDEEKVLFDSFEAAFMRDYERQLSMTYATSDREWFVDILKRELEVEDGLIQKDKYKEFITEELDGKIKEQPILKCVNDLAVENYTMREVFNMDSSVRLDAINNLAKFGSVAVVEALLDLLDDQEHDVRASACISLAKSRAGDLDMKIDRLMRCLRDSDRFVRESACIALGYVRADNAVPALLQIWRNDYISSVRDAAELALKQIGGDEVNRAMQMTNVLTAEIGELIKVLTGRQTSPKNTPRAKKNWTVAPFNTLPANFGATNNNNPAALSLAAPPNRKTID